MTADCSAAYTDTDISISLTGNFDVSFFTTQVVGG